MSDKDYRDKYIELSKKYKIQLNLVRSQLYYIEQLKKKLESEINLNNLLIEKIGGTKTNEKKL